MRTVLTSLVAGLVLAAAPAVAQTSLTTEPDSATLDEDTVIVVYPLLNDSAPGSIELVAVSVPSGGEVRVDGQAVVFTPDPDFNGEVVLTYTARHESTEAPGEIRLTVVPVNDPPTAVADAAAVLSGETVEIAVLANDVDVDGDTLTIEIDGVSNGSATVAGDRLVYAADADFEGVVEFEYTITDPAGASASAPVTVSVNSSAPVATLPPVTTSPPTTTAPPPQSEAGLTTSPQWEAPIDGLVPEPGAGSTRGVLATAIDTLGQFYLPLLTLLVVAGTAWLLGRKNQAAGVMHAVVLTGLEQSVPVYDKPAGSVIHQYPAAQRQIEVLGPARAADGEDWLPVASPGGRGWMRARFLTEDVASTSFYEDVMDMDLVRALRTSLKEGNTIATSPRGRIDPENFERDPERRELSGHAVAKLTALITDWRATFHVDKTASATALRPPQMRNLHWISFEAPGLDPWQLYFEYHDGKPHPVAALPERLPVTAV